MAHLQYQSVRNYDKVRDFLVKYQDRIIYGTDVTISNNEKNPEAIMKALSERWNQTGFILPTDSLQKMHVI